MKELYVIGYRLPTGGAVLYSKTYQTLKEAQRAKAGMGNPGGLVYEIFIVLPLAAQLPAQD